MKLNFLVLCLWSIVLYGQYNYSLPLENAFKLPPPCNSSVYCDSELLHDVQLAKLYNDSKTFVDMRMLRNESEILAAYAEVKSKYGGRPVPNNILWDFVEDNFMIGKELKSWSPPDFTADPSIVDRVLDPDYRQWVTSLNNVWLTLSVKVKDEVRISPDRYSMIWLPHGFIIPGGRFVEQYYWDTYWIVNGLILCDMVDTARGIIKNMVSLVDRYGYVPNGGRRYYEDRSQPPFLSLIVQNYYSKTSDIKFVWSVMSVLEKEFDFWMTNRRVTFQKDGVSYKMAFYNVKSRGPRPESYREDFEMAEQFDSEEEKNDFYCKIKSAAETGWDFSSRWFITANGTNRGWLNDTQAPSIVPVDLNSFLQKNAVILSAWFKRMGNEIKFNQYNTIAQELLNNIQNVMWVEEKGCWLDWDLINNKHRDYFYPSNLVPLWTESYSMPKGSVAKSVLKYLKSQRIIEDDYSVKYNGTPTSLYDSGQQWDYPNAWSSLQAFIIQGLDKTQDKSAQWVARELADVWLRSNYKGYNEDNFMYEKYDVRVAGKTGVGGEYPPQSGFGWTNGVVFEFLNRWGDVIGLNTTTHRNQTMQPSCDLSLPPV